MSNKKMAKDAITVVLVIVALGISLVVLGKAWGWIVRNWQNMNESKSYYCTELRKIVKAEPIFEDNGKHEDESYRVTYEDGSIGLIDQATMQSGYYCVSPSWEKDNAAKKKGLILQP